jgi:hypothetical protein
VSYNIFSYRKKLDTLSHALSLFLVLAPSRACSHVVHSARTVRPLPVAFTVRSKALAGAIQVLLRRFGPLYITGLVTSACVARTSLRRASQSEYCRQRPETLRERKQSVLANFDPSKTKNKQSLNCLGHFYVRQTWFPSHHQDSLHEHIFKKIAYTNTYLKVRTCILSHFEKDLRYHHHQDTILSRKRKKT